jgi:rhodanese-related sulfurtransferase
VIAKVTGMSVANTSRHLQVLRTAGMLVSRRDGLHVRYRLADPAVVEGYRALRTLAETRIGEVRQLADAFFGDVDGAEPVGLDELLTRTQSGEVLVVDVRPRLEFDAGHLPGAVNIPLDQLSARLADLDLETPVVAYCRGPYCVLAAQAVARLRASGVDARRLAGGPLEWEAAGFALASGT